MLDRKNKFTTVILSEDAVRAKDPYTLNMLRGICLCVLLFAPNVFAQSDPFAAINARLAAAAERTIVATDVTPAPRTQNVASESAPLPRVHSAVGPLLNREGLPAQLAAVMLVESGGNVNALSPKGARGAWQLMPSTARRYGLVVTPERDDRLDLALATRAAARYLNDLYRQFGNWPLALAAYNAGEQAVERAAARAGSRDFLSLVRALPAETRAYVPAVLNTMTRWGTSPIFNPAPRAASGRVVYAISQ